MSSSEEEEEDRQAVVIDGGSGFLKAGFSGDDAPRAVFPTVVGMAKYEVAMSGIEKEEFFIGDAAIRKRGVLVLNKPVQYGIVTDWDMMEAIWHHAFYNELRIEPEEHPVILTEPPLNPVATKTRLIQIMFETFNVPAIYIEVQGTLAIYASGRGSGMAIDVGDGVTHTLVVYEGYTLPHAMQRVDLGGWDLTNYLARILSEQGYSFTTTAEIDIVRDIKENLCYVAQDFEEELEKAQNSSEFDEDYQLPDNVVISISGANRIRGAEALFQPDLLGKEAMGLHEVVVATLEQCEIDTRSLFRSNLILVGGSTMFEGLAERLQKEVHAQLPALGITKVVAPPERKYSVWIGGSIISSLSTFENMWFTSEEYEEEGPEAFLEQHWQ